MIATPDFDGSRTFISTEVDRSHGASQPGVAARGLPGPDGPTPRPAFVARAGSGKCGRVVAPSWRAGLRFRRATAAAPIRPAAGRAASASPGAGAARAGTAPGRSGGPCRCVLMLIVAPPLIVQLANSTASWMPNSLALVLAGVTTDVSGPAAVAALSAWALVPTGVGLVAVQRRDVM